MSSITLKRALLETRSQLPPTFLLPWIANLSTTSTGNRTASESNRALIASSSTNASRRGSVSRPRSLATAQHGTQSTAKLPPPGSQAPDQSQPIQLSPGIRELLPVLRAQRPHYVTIHIHGKPYLITEGDTVRLPFLMHDVEPGDVIRLNRAINIGSRDFTLKAPAPAPKLKSPTMSTVSVLDPTTGTLASHSRVMPTGSLASTSSSTHAPHFVPHLAKGKFSYIDDRLFVCRAVVMGVESEPLRIKEKTKRRQRHVRKVKSKHRYTLLRIKEVRVRSLEELESEVD